MISRITFRRALASTSVWLHKGSHSLSHPNCISRAVYPAALDTRGIVTSHSRPWRPRKHWRSVTTMPVDEEEQSQAFPTGVVGVEDALVWIDCEMTGLNPDTDEILEIYCIITNDNLDIIDPEGFHAIIHWPKSRLDQMDEWCTDTHRSTGLTTAVLDSTTTPSQAADALYDYVTRFVPMKRTALLAGSSVHADRAFLRREPYSKVTDHLHYRILDISTIKEAAKRWSPGSVVENLPPKAGSHKARDDILESIGEAKYYRDAIFRSKSLE